MAQLASNVYNKCATYDFNLDGPITALGVGVNLGIVLNPGEFIIAAWYKVLTPFASPAPALDPFIFSFFTDQASPLLFLLTATTNGLNLTTGFWANCIQTTILGTVVRQTLTPQGTPSNNYLQGYNNANQNTAGAIAFNCLIGSTAL